MQYQGCVQGSLVGDQHKYSWPGGLSDSECGEGVGDVSGGSGAGVRRGVGDNEGVVADSEEWVGCLSGTRGEVEEMGCIILLAAMHPMA